MEDEAKKRRVKFNFVVPGWRYLTESWEECEERAMAEFERQLEEFRKRTFTGGE